MGEERNAVETNGSAPAGGDPTLINAGMTELDSSVPVNGTTGESQEDPSSTIQASTGDAAGNKAGDSWDASAAGATAGAESSLEEGYEMVPRDPTEVDTPSAVEANTAAHGRSWADEVPTEPPAGNKAAETWGSSTKETEIIPAYANGATDAAANGAQDDGFHEVAGRRGRGGGQRGRGGDGDFRGRGRGGRGRGGDGEFRGRGRGAFRGGRGDRGDGEHRGRGRGRGNRNDGAGPAPARGS